MILTRLKLTNLRAIETAEFRFQHGFTLLVGINGVGKSSVLDALRTCTSRILPSITKSRAKAFSFSVDDIRIDCPFVDAELLFEHNAHEFRFGRLQWSQRFATDDIENVERLRRHILDTDRLRDRARNLLRELDASQNVADTDSFTPSQAALKKCARESRVAANCIYFSTRRSIASNARVSKSKAAGDEAAAYAEALVARPLYLAQFAAWMRVQAALSGELKAAARHLEVFQSAVMRFLPDFRNLRPHPHDESRLVIDHGGVTLDVSQLSEGERGLLALVLDLARRLSQANPMVDDPLQDGEATVLIDEIDLHLHPKWQRTIVENLRGVFPRCQFIATTHSPQIVAAVEPEQVLLMTATGVVHPERSLGMDSNWILRHLMQAEDRPAVAVRAIRTVEVLIKKGAFKKARTRIMHEKRRGFDLPEWAVLEARMSRLERLR